MQPCSARSCGWETDTGEVPLPCVHVKLLCLFQVVVGSWLDLSAALIPAFAVSTTPSALRPTLTPSRAIPSTGSANPPTTGILDTVLMALSALSTYLCPILETVPVCL